MGFGGIGSGIANASDVAFNNPANLQVLTYNSTSSKWTNAAVPGGSGGPFGTYYLDARTYGVVADGTTDNRTSMTAAIAAATSLAQNGNDVVLQFPAGVIYTSTAMSSAYTDPNGTWMSAALGYGLPVNISGSITIQGVGINATIFKLSNNCRNLFWINQVAFNDVYQNITLQDFQVDFNGLTSSTRPPPATARAPRARAARGFSAP